MKCNHVAAPLLALLILSSLLTACGAPKKEAEPTLRLPVITGAFGESWEGEVPPATEAPDSAAIPEQTKPSESGARPDETGQKAPPQATKTAPSTSEAKPQNPSAQEPEPFETQPAASASSPAFSARYGDSGEDLLQGEFDLDSNEDMP